jgi:enoyl-CoA hydratase
VRPPYGVVVDSGPVRLAVLDEGVVQLTLDRPPANAINGELLDGLDRALAQVEADDDARAVVVTGEGAFFCGGFDLRTEQRDPVGSDRVVRLYRDAHRRLFALPKPTVALVTGHAIAGGLVIALACDRRVVADGEFAIGLNEVAIGASFPTAAHEIVQLRLPVLALEELMLEAGIHHATDAVRLGITGRLVAVADARSHAVELATRLGRYPREVYAHQKDAIVGAAVARIDAVALEDELAIAALWSVPESRAARAAQRARLG